MDFPKAVFFDNDGVLMDTEKHYFRAMAETLATKGVVFSREDFVETVMRRNIGPWHLLENKGVSPEEIQVLRKHRDRIYEHLLTMESEMAPAAREVVESLIGRATIGMVTSCKRQHLAMMHRRTGLLELMDFVLAHEDLPESKPSPMPYLMALERAKVKASEALVIEDSERGLISATTAGIRCWIVRTELTAGGNFSGAEKVIDAIAEVPALLFSGQ